VSLDTPKELADFIHHNLKEHRSLLVTLEPQVVGGTRMDGIRGWHKFTFDTSTVASFRHMFIQWQRYQPKNIQIKEVEGLTLGSIFTPKESHPSLYFIIGDQPTPVCTSFSLSLSQQNDEDMDMT
jgi:hypothetical protein